MFMRSQTEKQVHVHQHHAKKAICCLLWEHKGYEGRLVESCVFVVLGDGDGCGGARNKHPEVFMMRKFSGRFCFRGLVTQRFKTRTPS